MDKIETLLHTKRTVFRIDDLRIFWNESNPDRLKSVVKYYINNNRLISLNKGVYAITKDFDLYELAQKLIIPSYISLETALQKHGIIFQNINSITSFAQYTKTFLIKEQNYKYHAIKGELLLNPLGIKKESNYLIVCPERAVTDTLYLYGEYFFDNLNMINKDKILEIAKIYNQKILIKRVKKLLKE